MPQCKIVEILEVNETTFKQAVNETIALFPRLENNLRERNSAVKFFSILRGIIAEKAIVKWLEERKIYICAQEKKVCGVNIDILTQDGEKIEIKTSLIPDKYKKASDCWYNSDVKIIKREESFKEVDFDYIFQFYYNIFRERFDNYVSYIARNTKDMQEVLKTIQREQKKLYNSLHKLYFIGWLSKQHFFDIQKDLIKTKTPNTWSYGLRVFWSCPLTRTKHPDLFKYYYDTHSRKKIDPPKFSQMNF